MHPSHCNVIQVLGELRFSGAERFLQDAAPHFSEAGISLHILALGRRQGDFAPMLKLAGYQVYWLPATGGKALLAPFALLKSAWGFYQLCKNQSFEVAHIHLESAFLVWVMAAKLAGVPVVLRSVHNCFDIFSPWLSWRKKWERQLAVALGTRFLAVSAQVALTEQVLFQVPTTIVTPYLDLARFANATPPVSHEALGLPQQGWPILLSIGRLVPEKGHALLLDALLHVPHASLVILGEGPERNNLLAKAEVLGVSTRFFLVGNQTDVVPWLAAAAIFLMPSHYEGLGLVLWEAMAAGLPLLLSDLPVLREAAFGQGTFLNFHQPMAWAEAIHDLLENPDRRAQEGERNRETVLSNVQPGRSLQPLIALYRSAK